MRAINIAYTVALTVIVATWVAFVMVLVFG